MARHPRGPGAPQPPPQDVGGLRPARRTLGLAGVVLALVVSTHWLRVNVSPSVPLGLYWLTALPTPVARDTLVVLPVPPSVQAWLGGIALLKPVAAVEGEEVCVEQEWLRIRGEWISPLAREAHGMVLPRMDGCQMVPEGMVFLASAAPRSLDGRYWGMTPIAALTAQARALWIWR